MKRLELVFLAVLLSVSAAHSQARECGEWEAVYVGQPDEDGTRIYAAFGEAPATMPLPFTLTGVDRADSTLWEYRTIAWCYQGSGGCYMDLKLTDGTDISDDTDNPVRLVFVRSSKADTSSIPDILVIAGLNTDFLDAQTSPGPWSLAVRRFSDPEDVIVPPEVFYFDRCTGD